MILDYYVRTIYYVTYVTFLFRLDILLSIYSLYYVPRYNVNIYVTYVVAPTIIARGQGRPQKFKSYLQADGLIVK